jgi:hypothetical protein
MMQSQQPFLPWLPCSIEQNIKDPICSALPNDAEQAIASESQNRIANAYAKNRTSVNKH